MSKIHIYCREKGTKTRFHPLGDGGPVRNLLYAFYWDLEQASIVDTIIDSLNEKNAGWEFQKRVA